MKNTTFATLTAMLSVMDEKQGQAVLAFIKGNTTTPERPSKPKKQYKLATEDTKVSFVATDNDKIVKVDGFCQNATFKALCDVILDVDKRIKYENKVGFICPTKTVAKILVKKGVLVTARAKNEIIETWNK